jgi:fucose permease
LLQLLWQVLSSKGISSLNFINSRLGHYNPVLWFGYGIYFIGAGFQTTFGRYSTHAYIAGILVIEGFGVGWTLQTALVAAQALAPPKDRAVITGIRNLFRFTGGAFGLVISSAVMNNVIKSKLETSDLPIGIIDEIRGAEFNIPAGLSDSQMQTLLDAEMAGVKGVFYFLLGVSALTFFLSLAVEDHGLPGDEKKVENNTSQEKSGDLQQGVATQEGDVELPENTLAKTHSLP